MDSSPGYILVVGPKQGLGGIAEERLTRSGYSYEMTKSANAQRRKYSLNISQ